MPFTFTHTAIWFYAYRMYNVCVEIFTCEGEMELGITPKYDPPSKDDMRTYDPVMNPDPLMVIGVPIEPEVGDIEVIEQPGMNDDGVAQSALRPHCAQQTPVERAHVTLFATFT